MLDLGTLSVYAGVFTALIAAGFGFPMPEELPIVTAGVLARRSLDGDGAVSGWLLLALCILGVVLSDLLLYLIGRTWGVRLLRSGYLSGRLSLQHLERLEERFRRHGIWILLLARLLPGVRTAVFLTAGILRLPWRHFLLADGLYALPGVSLLFVLAYWFTDRFRDLVVQMEEALAQGKLVLIGMAVAALLIYFAVQTRRRPAE